MTAAPASSGKSKPPPAPDLEVLPHRPSGGATQRRQQLQRNVLHVRYRYLQPLQHPQPGQGVGRKQDGIKRNKLTSSSSSSSWSFAARPLDLRCRWKGRAGRAGADDARGKVKGA